jgi:hypothetical protein
MKRARRDCAALDELLPGSPLKVLRDEADAENATKFPWLEWLELNWLWVGLYTFIAALGLFLSIIAAFFHWQQP